MLIANPYANLLSQTRCDGADIGLGKYLSLSSPAFMAFGRGILSLWFRVDGGDGTLRYLLALPGVSVPPAQVYLDTDNKLYIKTANAATPFNAYLGMVSTSTFLAGGGWVHLLAAWDTTNVATAFASLYIDGSDDLGAPLTLNIDASNPQLFTKPYIGTDAGLGSYLDQWDGAVAEVYMNVKGTLPIASIDPSTESVRRKFISSAGKPVSLGANGEVAVPGHSPAVYLRLDKGQAASEFTANLGTAGAFTAAVTPTTASSSPSD